MRLFRNKPAISSSLSHAQTPTERWYAVLHHANRVRETWRVHLDAMCDYERAHPNAWLTSAQHERLQAVEQGWCARDGEAIVALLATPAPAVGDAIAKLELAIDYRGDTSAILSEIRSLIGIMPGRLLAPI